MFEVRYEKTGSKEKPSYEARLVWDTLYLKVATVYKGETTTEFGPMSCWVCDSTDGTAVSFKRKTLGALKDELESSLFQEIQKSRGLSSQPMPITPETTPSTVEPTAEPTREEASRKPTLFGRSRD